MRLSHSNRASYKVRVPVFCMLSFRPGNLIADPVSRPLSNTASVMRLPHGNRAPCKVRMPVFLSRPLPTGRVQSLAQRPYPFRPQHRPCACRMAIGHPAKSGCPFLYAILLTGRVQSLAKRPYPLRPRHRPCACRIAIGHPAKSGCPFFVCYPSDRIV